MDDIKKAQINKTITMEGDLQFNARRGRTYINQDIENGASVKTNKLGLISSHPKKIFNDTFESPAKNKDIYHHMISEPEGNTTIHLLSNSPSVHEPFLSYLSVDHYDSDKIPTAKTAYSGDNSGHGLGTRLYQEALKHHGKLQSDSLTSPSSNKLWSKLTSSPGISGKMGIEGDGESRHYAEMKKSTAIAKIDANKSLTDNLKDKAKQMFSKAEDVMSKEYSSDAQRRWAHTETGKEALGGEKAVEHWDKETKGKKLPEKIGKSGDWRSEGYTISHRSNKDGSLSIEAHSKEGNKVGGVTFVDKGDYIKNAPAHIVSVDQSHQRKGLATAMYRHAENVTGKKAKRGMVTGAGSKLWESFDKANGGYQGDFLETKGKDKDGGDFLMDKTAQLTHSEAGSPQSQVGGSVHNIKKSELKDYKIDHHTREEATKLYPKMMGEELDDKADSFMVAKDKDNKVIGHASIKHTKPGIGTSSYIYVDHNHRNKGIGSSMYEKFEEKTGRKVEPDKVRSPDSQAMWDSKDRKFGKSESNNLVDIRDKLRKLRVKLVKSEPTLEKKAEDPNYSLVHRPDLTRGEGPWAVYHHPAGNKTFPVDNKDTIHIGKFGSKQKALEAISSHKNNNQAPLEKGIKDLQRIIGPDHEKHAEAIKFAQSLPNSNWQEWYTKAYKKDNSIHTPENQESLKHFTGMQHLPEIKNHRFGTEDFKQGMESLKTKESQALSRMDNRSDLVPAEGEQITKPRNGHAWFSLGRGSCPLEAKAMGHCGNEPSVKSGDNILSLRKIVKHGGKEYHEPKATFIENDGVLGEMKGKQNKKPDAKYNEHIMDLFRTGRINKIEGGGYDPENNFHPADLSEAHQDELEKINPKMHNLFMPREKALESFKHKKLEAWDSKGQDEYLDAIHNALESRNVTEGDHLSLLNDSHPSVKNSVARSVKSPDIQKDIIAGKHDVDPKNGVSLGRNLRESLAHNRHLSPENQVALVKKVSDRGIDTLSHRNDLHPDTHKALMDNYGHAQSVAYSLSQRTQDPEIQKKLLEMHGSNPDNYIMSNIAAISKDPDVLDRIIDSEHSGRDDMTIRKLNRNKKVTLDQHKRFFNNHKDKPGFIREIAGETPHKEIQQHVIDNYNGNTNLLYRLRNSEHPEIAQQVKDIMSNRPTEFALKELNKK